MDSWSGWSSTIWRILTASSSSRYFFPPIRADLLEFQPIGEEKSWQQVWEIVQVVYSAPENIFSKFSDDSRKLDFPSIRNNSKNSFLNYRTTHFGLAFCSVCKYDWNFLYIKIFGESPVFHFNLESVANEFNFI